MLAPRGGGRVDGRHGKDEGTVKSEGGVEEKGLMDIYAYIYVIYMLNVYVRM